jgi:hypothetical protein
MELVQGRIVTDDVEGMAAFYARLVGASVALNEYYVEVPAGPVSVGFSRRRFTEYREGPAGVRSFSTSRSATSTRSSSGSARWAWTG